MKSFAFALALSVFSLPSLASAEVEYNEAEQNVSHDCGKDPVVSIVSASGTFAFTGACSKISVDGASNKLTVQSVDKISIAGSSNEIAIDAANKISVVGSANIVTWKKGVSGPKAKVGNVGSGNKISKVK